MFERYWQTIGTDKNLLVYSRVPWDSQYLGNTTVEIKEFTFTTNQEAKRLLLTLIKQLKLTKGDLLFFKTSPPADTPSSTGTIQEFL